MKVNRSHSVSDSPIGIKPRQSHIILCIMIYQQGMGINPAEKEETGENEAENEIEVPITLLNILPWNLRIQILSILMLVLHICL